jgi:hypothetical protein
MNKFNILLILLVITFSVVAKNVYATVSAKDT